MSSRDCRSVAGPPHFAANRQLQIHRCLRIAVGSCSKGDSSSRPCFVVVLPARVNRASRFRQQASSSAVVEEGVAGTIGIQGSRRPATAASDSWAGERQPGWILTGVNRAEFSFCRTLREGRLTRSEYCKPFARVLLPPFRPSSFLGQRGDCLHQRPQGEGRFQPKPAHSASSPQEM